MKLFEPLKIRNVTIHNRIYMLAMSRWNPGPFGGMATAYFARRARGGLGMLSTGIVQPETWWKTDELADELARFTDAIHTANPQTKVAIQPAAGVPGKWTSPSGAISKATHDSLVWGQSRMPSPEPVAITKEEIRQNVEKLAESCHLQERAGFDYVELHGTHGYLFRQFFSPLDNHREDEYGGSLENRMRFPLEAVRAIRAAVSDNFLIMYKMPYLEEEYGGITPDDACRFAIELEKAGVDILTVTQGVNSHPRGYVPSVVPVYNYLPPGCFVDYAAAIKKRVNIAVAAAGRINKPELAESILQQGQADIIGLGRQIMADPDWPNKVYSGAWGNIRYCLSCNNCLDWTYPAVQKRQGTMACTINPELTYERERKIVPADTKKKVMVIGGGPGGMEAAWVAAERGHDVTLYERSESLGGQLIAAAKPPNKEQFEDYRRYLTTELRRTGVNVKLGQAATLSTVRREKPDAIVVATGSAPRRLDIPGVRGRNVAIADDVLTGKAQVGERVLVVGGGLVGMETAEWLVAQGKVVTLVEILDEIGKDIFPLVRGGAVQKVKELGVLTYVNSYPEEITEDGARIKVNGTSEFMKFDSVVIAVGRQSENSLAKQMEGKAPEVHVIGDTVSPRRIRDAVWDGYEVATKL